MPTQPAKTQTATRRRRAKSRYGAQLQEKQDLKSLFGIV
jgi:hypothetical protein